MSYWLIPPKWVDEDNCHFCRKVFSSFSAKYHCRHCGFVFCAECTTMRFVLPEFGYTNEVRVCAACHQALIQRSEQNLNLGNAPYQPWLATCRSFPSRTSSVCSDHPEPSAPPLSDLPDDLNLCPSSCCAEEDDAAFVANLRHLLQIFLTRLRGNSARGRDLAVDTALHATFGTIRRELPRLLQKMRRTEEAREFYERLQDKVAKVADARMALEALRTEFRAQRRAEEERLRRENHQQMLGRLELLRRQKMEALAQQSAQMTAALQQQEEEQRRRLEAERQRHLLSQFSLPPPPPTPPTSVLRMPQRSPPPLPFPTPSDMPRGPEISAVESVLMEPFRMCSMETKNFQNKNNIS